MNGAGQPAEQQQHGGQAFQLIDTKLLGKPTNFSGLDKDYKEWAFSFSCWFSCMTLNANTMLEVASEAEEEVRVGFFRGSRGRRGERERFRKKKKKNRRASKSQLLPISFALHVSCLPVPDAEPHGGP